MKRFRKFYEVTTLIIVVSFLFSFFSPYLSFEASAASVFDDCGKLNQSQYQTLNGIPANLHTNSQGFKINTGLFHLYGIAAYGSISESQPATNSFYPGYQSDGPVVENKGRFHNPGEGCGEYRYYGFDFNGNLYANLYFKDDFARTYNDGNNQWIYQPWDTLPNWYGAKPLNAGAAYGLGVTEPMLSPNFSGIRKNLDDSINFSVNRGVSPRADSSAPLDSVLDNMPPASGDKLANYAVINTAPGLLTHGTATMFHYNKIAATNILYITYPLLPLKETGKEETPVEGDFPTRTIDLNDPKYKTKEIINLNIPVEGTLKDEAFYLEPSLRIKHYTRYDIKDFSFELKGTDFTLNENNVGKVQNEALPTKFSSVEIKRSSIPTDGKYPVTLKTKVTHLDGKTKEHSVTKFIQFTSLDAPKLLTDFQIQQVYAFRNTTEFMASHVGYKNTTHVDQNYDQIKIEVCEPFSSTCATPFTSTKSAFTDAAAQNSIYNFIKSKFSPTDAPDPMPRHFVVTQTITNTTLNISATKVKEVHVIQTDSPEPIEIIDNEINIIVIPPVVTEQIIPSATIPDRWYDVVGFPATDSTTGWVSRSVSVDGVSVDPDAFFSGNWEAGVGNHGLKNVRMEWETESGLIASINTWTVIYDTKPRVQIDFDGLWKQNRTMKANNTSAIANDPFVTDSYPLTYSFEFLSGYGGIDSSLRTRSNTNMFKEFMYKQSGIYAVSLTATNSLGRVSDPYIVQFEILNDEDPAIIIHAYDQQVPRNEKVRLLHDVVSVDGDQIATKWVKLWHDANNDGTYESLIQTHTGMLTEIIPPANKLGSFKLEGYAKESTTQSTMTEFMSAADYKDSHFESLFEVANYQPMSELYVDRPIERPNVDVYFMLDRALAQSKINYMNGNEVTNANKLLNINVLPAVDTWDMKTYTYSTSGSTSRNTGGSYPPSSTYYSSGGYSGTIPRTSVSNSPYSVDEGSYKTRPVSTTESSYFSGSCYNSRYRSKNADGTYTSWSGSDNDCPSSQSVNSNGYSGSIPRTGTTQIADEEFRRSWRADYGGSLSKTVTTSETYWDPDWVSYDDYTGYYSGSIYKDVRQPYDNTFMRTVSDKYIVYISDGSVSQLNDLNMVLTNNDATLICVGTTTMQSQVSCDNFILNNGTKTIDVLVDEVIDFIKLISPANERIYRLINESVTINAGTGDIENDPIINERFKVWWDPSWFGPGGFDNSEGAATGVKTSYAAATWGTFNSTVSYNKPGKYHLIRRVQDRPTTDPNFSQYNLYSNEATVELIVHRKPIADVILDWDYDPGQNNYKTVWVDNSYDKDHQLNHPQKGIVDRALTLRNNSTGVTLYTIPARLYAGSYSLTYAARDVEGAWSDTISKNFTLASAPPMQMTANANVANTTKFSMSSVPASEQLRATNQWTRYPYNVQLNYGMYQSGSLRTTNQTKLYTTSNGTKVGNDITWTNTIFTIPATLADGLYQFRVSAIGQYGQTDYRQFNTRVFTPVNLMNTIIAPSTAPNTDVSQLTVNYSYIVHATTSKYVNSLRINAPVSIFSNSSQRSLTLASTSGDLKHWSTTFTVTHGVTANAGVNYNLTWTATTPNGRVTVAGDPVSITKPYTVISNTPPMGDFKVYTYTEPAGAGVTTMPIFEGDTLRIKSHNINDNENDQLSVTYEVLNPAGTRVVNQNYTQNSPYSPTTRTYIIPAVSSSSGTWTVQQTISDGKAPAVIRNRTFVVNALSIAGEVVHTPQWEINRMAYNQSVSGTNNSPWVQTRYLAGERFVLSADTSNTTGSSTVASQVTATLLETGDAVTLSSSNGRQWTGELWDESFVDLDFGPYRFRFRATYSNGTVKTHDVNITINQTLDDYYELVRTK